MNAQWTLNAPYNGWQPKSKKVDFGNGTVHDTSGNRLKTLKSQVEYCLKEFPQTRNCDIELSMSVWYKFYMHVIENSDKAILDGEYWYIRPSLLKKLPREDNIKRIRAQFQSKGKYLPDNPSVRRKRQISEEQWRKFIGYDPELRTV